MTPIAPHVYIVGAGPGDPDLLTLKAKYVLETADVILYDFLAHPGCLAHTRPEAQRICVGKRKGNHGKTQSQINTLLLKYAKKNKTIVRLKGGDPMIFGRITEELDVLKKARIPYSIIPGISAFQGVASAGIPLTHRIHSRSFAVLTGTTAQHKTLSQKEIPDADSLLVFMPKTDIQTWVSHLIKNTRHNWNTPIAIVSNATSATQNIVLSTLQELYDNGLPTQTPILVMIGKAASAYPIYQWQSERPLNGWRLWLTAEALPELAKLETLKREGLEICHIPMTTSQPLSLGKKWNQAHLEKADYWIFCSPRAVIHFFRNITDKNLDIRIPVQIAAVGIQTAAQLRQCGLHVSVTPQHTAGATALLAALPVLKNKTLHVYGAKKLATDLLAQLRQRGAKAHHHALYETKPRKQPPVLSPFDTKDIAIVSSPNQARLLEKQHGFPPTVVTLGTSTHAACIAIANTQGITFHKSPEATYVSAIETALSCIRRYNHRYLAQ